MPDVKRGYTFTHKHFIDPNYAPDVDAGEKYATGPKATMVVTRATKHTIYYRYAPLPGAGTRYCMGRTEFEQTYGSVGA